MSCLEERWDTASGLTELVASLVFEKFGTCQFDFVHQGRFRLCIRKNFFTKEVAKH